MSLWDNKSGMVYTRSPKFTCIAVSGGGSDNGHVVVGSADGTIRLYNSATRKAVSTATQTDRQCSLNIYPATAIP